MMASVDAVILDGMRSLRPPPHLDLSDWADRHFYLSAESAAEPGRWKTLPYQREPMNAITDPKVEYVTFMKSARVGYALAVDTPLPTPNGWTTMSDIAAGDQLFDHQGFVCRVLFKSRVFTDHECYRLTFCDGSSIVADAGHQWFVDSDVALEHLSAGRRGRTGRPKPGQFVNTSGVLDTETIARSFRSRGGRRMLAVVNARPLVLPDVPLPVPPYTLGVWLGDGNRDTPRITMHRSDAEEVARYIERDGIRTSVRYIDDRYPDNATIFLDVPVTGRPVSRWAAKFRELGVLGRKHVPGLYLRSSRFQRWLLLSGLMDSDGTCGADGRAEFVNTNENLARGVYELVVSLGMKASFRECSPQRAGCLPQYRVNFKGEHSPFRLKRKSDRVLPSAKPSITRRRRIVSVERVGPVAVQCIQVDSPSCLFLAGRQMVPTHNTKMLNAAVAYHMHQDPCPIQVVQPTVEDAEGYSKEELAPMLRDCQVLSDLMPDSKTRDSNSTILHKIFRGGSLSVVGANSGRGFRRVSRRVMAFDETDGYPLSAGNEGDPIKLGIRRTEYYWNRKIILGSTPLLSGLSVIERYFLAGDQRRYYVPCTQCGHEDYLVFQREAMDGGEPVGHFMQWPAGQPEQAHFVCRSCGGMIEHHDKRAIVEAGHWRPHTEFSGHASFHIWAAYSFSPNASWAQIATEFLEANAGGPDQLKTFVNTVLGETWQERGEAPDWMRLYERREPYAVGTCPPGVLFLTAGVDVQKTRFVYEVVGWGRGKTSWSVDQGVIEGDTADLSPAGPWPHVNALLERSYEVNGVPLSIVRLAIDSGFNTQTVYNWARQHPLSRVIAVKGVDTASVLVGVPSVVDVQASGKKLKRGYRVWSVAGHIAKTELYGWLKLGQPTDEARAAGAVEPPGYCHFPQHGEEYFKQLTAEQLVRRRTRAGFVKLTWEPIPGRENHVLDCRVYARAAAAVVGLDRFQESDWLKLERAVGFKTVTQSAPVVSAVRPVLPRSAPAPAAIPRRPGWIGHRRPGRWLKGGR